MAASVATRFPPELFMDVLQYVGPLPVLRDLQSEHRKDAKYGLATCSLVCKYWAKQCRPKAFDCIQIKGSCTRRSGYKSLRSLALLVSKTPQSLQPISEYIKILHLYREINDADWYDSVEFNTKRVLQLSQNHVHKNERCAVLLPNAEIYAHAVQAGQSMVYPIEGPLNSSRNIPLFCQRIILEEVQLYWLPGTLRSLLKIFRCIGPSVDLEMRRVFWVDDNDRGRSVIPLLDINMNISARFCRNPAEAVWSAFTMLGRSSIYYVDPSGHQPHLLLLHASELETMKSISQVLYDVVRIRAALGDADTRLQISRGTLNGLAVEDDLVCAVSIHRLEDPRPIGVTLGFYVPSGRRLTENVWEVGFGAEQYEYVCKVVVSFEASTTERNPMISDTPISDWDRLISLLLQLPELTCIELLFAAYSDLVRFVRAQRTTLGRLGNRVKLQYDAPCEGVDEVHLHTRYTVEIHPGSNDVEATGSVEVKARPDHIDPCGSL
ncbi:hypothetical protein BDW22DRAFT_1356776 [Trametopsis cervina]|nr:hypothetical protein BDW22DRAFT_1356776 [Trametopsis cervina]